MYIPTTTCRNIGGVAVIHRFTTKALKRFHDVMYLYRSANIDV